MIQHYKDTKTILIILFFLQFFISNSGYYGIDSMETIMMKFQDSSAWNLPVVKDDKYYGFISKSKLLTVYRRKLIEVTS